MKLVATYVVRIVGFVDDIEGVARAFERVRSFRLFLERHYDTQRITLQSTITSCTYGAPRTFFDDDCELGARLVAVLHNTP